MINKILIFIKSLIPKKLFEFFQPTYHWLLAFLAALIYRFPSRKIFVVGVTGTKGKTSVLEIMSAILEQAGYKTALVSTLRFKIGKESERNEKKMTTPGRFFLQRFLRRAAKEKCQYALLEMTSQGVSQFRHKFIGLDAVIFTNLSLEHIEAHGSFEKYKEAKLKLFEVLEKSYKKKKVIIVNGDDKNAVQFLDFKADEKWVYGLNSPTEKINIPYALYPSSYILNKFGIKFVVDAKEFNSGLLGEFNLYNILAAAAFVRSQAVGWGDIKIALENFKGIPGRVEFVEEGQDFKVVVDYAHTPDSLEKLYEVFQTSRKICVLGAAGGGRDKWKRAEMGKIAAACCDEVILTNEDPYDESPKKIVEDIAEGIKKSPFKYKMIINRREAIAEALKIAKTGDTVLITGKGTDPWIMGPKGTKIEWDDREVVREELALLKSSV
ncbi:UDP-N-acetylmuramoyl-L-alanyl-D-glutamate--2,6-diaminopimelate ligase [Patescibacteria group bacterium]|nr:UDP-N-acetylmuramoyl-L-alanyl-D-glutamate--2,6-diaminopimelate ligase [Patescibacteria group bacterium]